MKKKERKRKGEDEDEEDDDKEVVVVGEKTKRTEAIGVEKGIPAEKKRERTNSTSSSKTRRQNCGSHSLFPFECMCMHHRYTT